MRDGYINCIQETNTLTIPAMKIGRPFVSTTLGNKKRSRAYLSIPTDKAGVHPYVFGKGLN